VKAVEAGKLHQDRRNNANSCGRNGWLDAAQQERMAPPPTNTTCTQQIDPLNREKNEGDNAPLKSRSCFQARLVPTEMA
jgi:hypothetical protein